MEMFYFDISAQNLNRTWKGWLVQVFVNLKTCICIMLRDFQPEALREAPQKRQSNLKTDAGHTEWTLCGHWPSEGCCLQRDGFTFCEAPLRRPLSHNALFPVGSSSTSSLVLGGRRTWQSQKKFRHLSLQLLSSTGLQMFFGVTIATCVFGSNATKNMWCIWLETVAYFKLYLNLFSLCHSIQIRQTH